MTEIKPFEGRITQNIWGSAVPGVMDDIRGWGWTTHRMTAQIGESVEIPMAKPRPCNEHRYVPPPFPSTCQRPGCSYA